jgi:hypothetical protein
MNPVDPVLGEAGDIGMPQTIAVPDVEHPVPAELRSRRVPEARTDVALTSGQLG